MAKRARKESLASLDAATAAAVPPAPKYASVEPEPPPASSTMRCLLPPHQPLGFATYAEYESHYRQSHVNRCVDCKKNFPTTHFLELHIAENHDPITASKREAGEKTYACFVEGCEKVCRDWKKRRSHLVDKHGYPKNYEFKIVDYGIDGRRSMLRPGIDAQGHRKSSRERGRSNSSLSGATQSTEATSLSEQRAATSSPKKADVVIAEQGGSAEPKDVTVGTAGAVDDLASSMSALSVVPRSITFGKRKGRAGFAKS